MLRILLIALLFGLSNLAVSQAFPFDIKLEAVTISGLPGLQSYSYGQHDGKCLVVGGRTDGLHRRQPSVAFDLAGHNTQLIVIDPVSKQFWSTSMSSLSTNLQEQLRATNAQFIQDGDYLYIFGGYGYSAAFGDHKTFEYLTIIDVAGLIGAIINGNSITPYFTQLSDTNFAVTGGQLVKVYDKLYLVGGQKFTGRYNPMGGPSFTQAYTNQVRIMKIVNNGGSFTVTHFPYLTDSAHLHRRDFNAAPQIMPNGQQGVTSFSGVFQVNMDVPYLYCSDIDTNGLNARLNFSQYYNHYECPMLPAYNASVNTMSTVFFGGISQYFDDNGQLTMDNNVPFVNTIARVSRDANGNLAEYKLPVVMPGLLGASAHLIHDEKLAYYSNGVLILDSLTKDTNLVGYIYGGISSTAPNIFFTNTGTQSSASANIYKVYLIKNPNASIDQENPQSKSSLQLQLYPNPNDGVFKIAFNLQNNTTYFIRIYDMNGRLIMKKSAMGTAGQNIVAVDLKQKRGVFMVKFSAEGIHQNQKVILR